MGGGSVGAQLCASFAVSIGVISARDRGSDWFSWLGGDVGSKGLVRGGPIGEGKRGRKEGRVRERREEREKKERKKSNCLLGFLETRIYSVFDFLDKNLIFS